MPAVLEAREVRASYGGLRAVQGVTLAVPPRSLVAVIGANGAGKSTLLRVLAGLHRPDGGRLFLEGADVTGWAAHRLARRGVILVPEGRGIFPALTVEENLRLLAADRDRVSEAFPVLVERLGQGAGTLSGGEQQMLALAAAFSRRARVTLLDEPSMGLAPRLVDRVFASIELLRSAGMAVVLVEQYVHRALEVADLVYVMQKGRCVFAGEPGELAHHPSLERAYLGGAA